MKYRRKKKTSQLFIAPLPCCRGHPTAGGTATAFELLALTLADSNRYNVTLVGLYESTKHSDKAHKAHEKFLKGNYHFEYLSPESASFSATTSHPHEGMALAVYEWASARNCDVLHGKEAAWNAVEVPHLMPTGRVVPCRPRVGRRIFSSVNTSTFRRLPSKLAHHAAAAWGALLVESARDAPHGRDESANGWAGKIGPGTGRNRHGAVELHVRFSTRAP